MNSDRKQRNRLPTPPFPAVFVTPGPVSSVWNGVHCTSTGDYAIPPCICTSAGPSTPPQWSFTILAPFQKVTVVNVSGQWRVLIVGGTFSALYLGPSGTDPTGAYTAEHPCMIPPVLTVAPVET